MIMHTIPRSYGSTDAAGFIERVFSSTPHDIRDVGGHWALYDKDRQLIGHFSEIDAALVRLFGEPGYTPRHSDSP
jgi:hypothetical protein